MTNAEKQRLEQRPTLAYWSMWGGLEIKDMEYGIEDYLYCISGTFAGPRGYHRLRIQYKPNGDWYVVLKGRKYYGVDCIADRR